MGVGVKSQDQRRRQIVDFGLFGLFGHEGQKTTAIRRPSTRASRSLQEFSPAFCVAPCNEFDVPVVRKFPPRNQADR